MEAVVVQSLSAGQTYTGRPQTERRRHRFEKRPPKENLEDPIWEALISVNYDDATLFLDMFARSFANDVIFDPF